MKGNYTQEFMNKAEGKSHKLSKKKKNLRAYSEQISEFNVRDGSESE